MVASLFLVVFSYLFWRSGRWYQQKVDAFSHTEDDIPVSLCVVASAFSFLGSLAFGVVAVVIAGYSVWSTLT